MLAVSDVFSKPDISGKSPLTAAKLSPSSVAVTINAVSTRNGSAMPPSPSIVTPSANSVEPLGSMTLNVSPPATRKSVSPIA